MKTKETYSTPTIEIIRLETETTLMTGSPTFDLKEAEQDYNEAAYSRKRSFWE